MARAKQSLEEGLDRSANKRGFSGKSRHRYIGGAIRNMEKRGEITVKKRAAKSRAGGAPARVHHKVSAPAPKTHKSPASTPARGSVPVAHRPAPAKPRTTLTLEVKVNKAASEKVPYHKYKIYSIYDKTTGKQHGNGTFRSAGKARDEAKIEMDAHNHPKGEHTRARFA